MVRRVPRLEGTSPALLLPLREFETGVFRYGSQFNSQMTEGEM